MTSWHCIQFARGSGVQLTTRQPTQIYCKFDAISVEWKSLLGYLSYMILYIAFPDHVYQMHPLPAREDESFIDFAIVLLFLCLLFSSWIYPGSNIFALAIRIIFIIINGLGSFNIRIYSSVCIFSWGCNFCSLIVA